MDFIDQNVLKFFMQNRTEWLSVFMVSITYAGSYMLIGGTSLLSAASFYIHRHTEKIIPLFTIIGGSAATTYAIKHLFSRARPLTEAFYLETGSSFPSGHATFAMALYGFFIYITWKADEHHLKNPLIIFLAILIFLVGLSRLYLGVHYLSDVLGGYLVGFIWILIGSAVSKSKLSRLPDALRL